MVIEKKNLPKCAISITSKLSQSTTARIFKLADMRTILSIDMLQRGFLISTIPVLISYQNLVQFSSKKYFVNCLLIKRFLEEKCQVSGWEVDACGKPHLSLH